VIAGGAVQSAAAPSSAVAPDSLASLYGANLASGLPKPAPSRAIGAWRGDAFRTDAAGATRAARCFTFRRSRSISWFQTHGARPATFDSFGSDVYRRVQSVAPTLFSTNRAGSGVAAAPRLWFRPPTRSYSLPCRCFNAPDRAAFRCRSFWVSTRRLRELLRHGYQKSQLTGKCGGDHRRHRRARLVRRPRAGLHRLDQVNAGLILSLRAAGSRTLS